MIIAESAIGTADAARVSAAASLYLAQIDLSWATVEAPYPGVITTVHTEVGAWLAVGQAVVSMVNDLDLEVEADVPSSRVEALTDGTAVALILDDGSEHTAVVRTVVPEENALTRTRRVRFTPHFAPMRKALAVNQSATVLVPVGAGARGAHRAQGTPSSAIRVRRSSMSPRTGLRRSARCSWARPWVAASRCWAASAPGEPVVVRGNERLRPGQAIAVGGAG